MSISAWFRSHRRVTLNLLRRFQAHSPGTNGFGHAVNTLIGEFKEFGFEFQLYYLFYKQGGRIPERPG